jgi:hypothetical protein
MENRTQPMEVNEFELVNEVELGDETITPFITSGVGGSENAPDQPLTIDTPHSDPSTLGTPTPTDSQILGSAPTPANVSSGTSAYEKKNRQKTSKVWDDFSQIEVGGVKKSQRNWCKRLFLFPNQVLPQHLVGIWVLVSNMWSPTTRNKIF